MEDTGRGEQSEAEEGGAVGWVGEDVEQTEDGERNNILDVVLMSSSYSLDVLIGSALITFVLPSIWYARRTMVYHGTNLSY